ncbi:helix-turn-helix domain-containing protein [Methylobacterium oxalidis]|uniref:helix-turn-helix domain-containing protein n=1 Tax=Methylobacterium oxalidis TaxID=944322 RepID=UPI0033149A35
MARMSLEEALARTPDIDRAKVEAATDEEILQHAREDGDDPNAAEGWLRIPLHREVRAALNLTQEEFAATIRVPVSTIRNWEQGRTSPEPAARTLLALIAADPAHALKLLGGRSSGRRGRPRRFT